MSWGKEKRKEERKKYREVKRSERISISDHNCTEETLPICSLISPSLSPATLFFCYDAHWLCTVKIWHYIPSEFLLPYLIKDVICLPLGQRQLFSIRTGRLLI